MNDVGNVLEMVSVVLIVAVIFVAPRKLDRKRRMIAGFLLSLIGWAGVLSGVLMDNLPFFQSDHVVYGWLGTSMVALMLSIALLVPVALESMAGVDEGVARAAAQAREVARTLIPARHFAVGTVHHSSHI